jgi:beta-glucosidase
VSPRKIASAVLFLIALPLGCGAGAAKAPETAVAKTPPKTWGAPWVPRSGTWPSQACSQKAAELLGRMTLAEKVGQMTQAERRDLEPGDIQRYALGSVLSAGGSAPGGATKAEWADMLDAMHAEALASRLGIPLLYGVDAVHGHNNVLGATIFPHNIGLGAANDPELVRAVARATAVELEATGVDWTFAPMVAAARDERWGRTYETFSEDPRQAGALGAAAIRGLQGDRLGGEPGSILACAKHFAGDGTTSFKSSTVGGFLDQGDSRLPPADFERLAIAPYRPAIAVGVGSIMVSFSSVHGKKSHGDRRLLTNVLKGELGFRGFLVSDYIGIHQLPGSYADQVTLSVNAGLDLFMEAEREWKPFIETLTDVVQRGRVPLSRIDDAVTRILTVKCESGLFEKAPTEAPELGRVGSPEHRALARRAVRQSVVLLKNDGGLLPLKKSSKILVAGSGANSLTRQAGGWTLKWQGAEEQAFPGTTLLDALRGQAEKTDLIRFDETGTTEGGDVALLVMSEPAYAEMKGDTDKLSPSAEDLRALDALHQRKLPTIVVLLSGRPLIIEPELVKAQAWLAAWLPGSAGEGVIDVLYGDHAPTAKLSHSWPRKLADVPVNAGDAKYDPLFALGHGLTYAAASTTQPAPRASTLAAPR